MMSWLWQQNVDTVTILLLFSLNLQFAIWTSVSPEFNCFLSGTNCLCDVFLHTQQIYKLLSICVRLLKRTGSFRAEWSIKDIKNNIFYFLLICSLYSFGLISNFFFNFCLSVYFIPYICMLFLLSVF